MAIPAFSPSAARVPSAGQAAQVAAALRPNGTRTSPEHVAEGIRRIVLLGLMDPGERLPAERELVLELAVSRTTVREALRTLASEGLVEPRRGRGGGTFIVHHRLAPSREEARRLLDGLGPDLRDALDLREAVEPVAARLAALRGRPSQLERLAAVHADELAAEAIGDKPPRNSRTHLAIAQVAGSASLREAVIDAHFRLRDALAAIASLDVSIRRADRQHEDLIAAILARDAGRAEALMREHVQASADVLLAWVDGGGRVGDVPIREARV